nr:hypothetical protein [Tanacetum cinerariifolium]
KIILHTYGDIVTLKRRRDDDADKDEEPSAGSNRGSKRRREGKEPESKSAPNEKATRTTGAFAFALTSVTQLLEYLTLDLLSMIDKHSRGILSKNFLLLRNRGHPDHSG